LTDISDSGAALVSPRASAPGADTVRRSNTPNAADKNLFFDMKKPPLNLFSLIKQIRRGFCDRKKGIFQKIF